MAATSNKAIPIVVGQVRGTNGAQAAMRRIGEKSGQTALIGTPCRIEAASGFIIPNPTINSAATAIIAGFTAENFSNLTTSATAKTITLPNAPQNQPSAVIIPVGVPPNDGTIGFNVANDANIFIGIVGGSTNGANATALTDVGSIFGLTKDGGNNYWYVDKDITTTAGGACVEVVELLDAAGTANGRVYFRVTQAAQQLNT